MGTDELPWCGSHVKFFGLFLRTPSGGIFCFCMNEKYFSDPTISSLWTRPHFHVLCSHPSPSLSYTSVSLLFLAALSIFPPDCKICKYWITVVAYHYMTRHTVAQWLRTPAHRFPEFWFTSSFAGFQRPCPMASLRQRADWIALP